jgi:hypothetical protein
MSAVHGPLAAFVAYDRPTIHFARVAESVARYRLVQEARGAQANSDGSTIQSNRPALRSLGADPAVIGSPPHVPQGGPTKLPGRSTACT